MNRAKIWTLLIALLSTPVYSSEYLINVNGMVCDFCAVGVTKKVSKLAFIDHTKFDRGVNVEIEDQTVTIAVKDGEEVDKRALFAAITASGYHPVDLWKIMPSGENILQ